MASAIEDEIGPNRSISNWPASIYAFFRDWWASRPFGLLCLIGLSAVVFTLFVVTFVAPTAARESARASYFRRAGAAEKAENWLLVDRWLLRAIELGDRRPTTRYLLASNAERMGQKVRAEILMREIVADEPFPPALAWLAVRSLDANATKDQIEKAIVLLKDAMRLSDDDENLLAALADAYARTGKLRQSANCLDALANKQGQYYLPLARTYFELGDSSSAKNFAAKAEKYFESKALQDPENEDLIEAVASSLLLQGKWDDALGYVRRRIANEEKYREISARIHTVASDELIKNPKTRFDAIRHLYQALATQPSHRPALLRLGELADEIWRISPQDIAPLRKWLAIAHDSEPDNLKFAKLLGILQALPGPDGDLEEAEVLLQKASSEDPLLLLAVADVQERRKNLKGRDQTLQAAVKRLRQRAGNSDDSTYIALADAQVRLGEFKEAESMLLAELEKRDSRILRAALSQAYFRQAERMKDDELERERLLVAAVKASDGHGPSEAALAELSMSSPVMKEKIVSDAADLTSSGKAIRAGHMIQGIVAVRESRWADSVFHFSQALNRTPNDPILQNNLAWSLAKRNEPGDSTLCLELAEIVVAQAPLNPDIRETRGVAYMVNRQWANAISDLEFSLQSYPDRKDLHALLSEAYKGIGNAALSEKHSQLAK